VIGGAVEEGAIEREIMRERDKKVL